LELQLTLADWQSQVPVLHRVLRLLPLSSSGVAIVNAALPGSFGPDVAQQSPPGSYWFFEVLLTVRRMTSVLRNMYAVACQTARCAHCTAG
jgi:hypothetical protein